MHCSKCDRDMTRCICLDADARINELEKSPHIHCDWNGLRAIRALNIFDIERDRAEQAKKDAENPSLTKAVRVKELFAEPRELDAYWQTFYRESGLNRPDIGETQRREMKRGFYAGMDCMLHACCGLADLPEKKGLKWLERWREGIIEFAKMVQEKKA